VIIWTAAQQVLARFEVETAIARGEMTRLPEPCLQGMLAHLLPSVRDGSRHDGYLGEIDQDGYVFTTDSRDQTLFPNRPLRNPKRHHRLALVVRGGIVCVRKTFQAMAQSTWSSRVGERLLNGFWVEAAALLRLRGCEQVPAIRHIDRAGSAIEIEYIRGKNLRNILKSRSTDLSYRSAENMFDRILKGADSKLSSEIAAIIHGVIKRGVAPRDIHAANFIQADDSGLLYMVDYHLSWLRPVHPFTEHAKELRNLVKQ
jgi:hypothetical protein